MAETPSLSGPQAQDFVKRYPALTTRVAMRAAQRAGMDINDPQTVLQVTQTDEFKQQAASAVNNRGDENFLRGFASNAPTMPDSTGSNEQQRLSLYQGQEQQATSQFRAQSIISNKILDASTKAAKLAEFDQTAYKTKRLKEMNPTSDIDSQMLNLRFRQLGEEADMRSNPRFAHLSPAQKERLIQQNQSETTQMMGELRDLRNARLSGAEGQVDEEISSQNSRISSAKAAVDMFKEMESQIEKTGQGAEALFAIRKNRLEYEKEVAKARAKGGTASWETVYQYILEDLQRSGIEITKESKDQAEIHAKRIADKSKQFTGNANKEGLLRTESNAAASDINRDAYPQNPQNYYNSPERVAPIGNNVYSSPGSQFGN